MEAADAAAVAAAEAHAEALAGAAARGARRGAAGRGRDPVAEMTAALLRGSCRRLARCCASRPRSRMPFAAALPPDAPPVIGDAAVAPGDAVIAWAGGSTALVLAERRAAIAVALEAAGIAVQEEDA
jgi:hypothetical protein